MTRTQHLNINKEASTRLKRVIYDRTKLVAIDRYVVSHFAQCNVCACPHPYILYGDFRKVNFEVCYLLENKVPGVYKRWTGLLEWITGLDWTTGLTFDLKYSPK